MEQPQTTKKIVAAVYDSKVKQHLQPMAWLTVEEAIRAFGAAAREEKTDFNRFSEDYTLWILGHYVPETGALVPTDRIQIASASEFKN